MSLVKSPKRTIQERTNLRRKKKNLTKDGIQAAHHITTKAAAITTNKMKATPMATETMTGGMKATNATRGTTAGMKATLMDIRGATGPTTLAMKATLVMTMGMTSKAMVEVMAAMTLGSKGTIAGAKDMDGRTGLHVRGITGLTMTVPMGGNSATASNLVKSGTAASSHSRLTTSGPYKRSGHKTRSRVLKSELMYVQLGHWTASISVWWRGFADSSPLRHVRLAGRPNPQHGFLRVCIRVQR